jgi:hypothetical protein
MEEGAKRLPKVLMGVPFREHGTDPMPHEGSCEGCREARVCNVCGADVRHDRNRCTNGRCGGCHGKHCSPESRGGGHGFWKSPQDRASAMREKSGP